MPNQDDLKTLSDHAYGAMDRGALAEASRAFDALLPREPDNRYYHYMRGLAHKYMLDWPVCLHANLRAIELCDEFGEAEHWNAAIAATALGDWATVRRLWSACGIRIPEGDGPIHGDYGVAVVRLHPWQGGETVFMRRIDPVRARLLNVPLPESGHLQYPAPRRFGCDPAAAVSRRRHIEDLNFGGVTLQPAPEPHRRRDRPCLALLPCGDGHRPREVPGHRRSNQPAFLSARLSANSGKVSAIESLSGRM
ncbi:hypothetical protein PQS31_09825 [Luteimonas sp BLCC-B24]|uniref:hypothetical protein n=1 Tax=Luteimonas sp. BLCC-B24 TaxID=3025317 RepID=UPI00234D53D8|nr:hypothetical protein [Luteimonas sp. BLCC-B24]MDC7807118.1 hypothetical protein [Luteimonas sp. BLCC-B24]